VNTHKLISRQTCALPSLHFSTLSGAIRYTNCCCYACRVRTLQTLSLLISSVPTTAHVANQKNTSAYSAAFSHFWLFSFFPNEDDTPFYSRPKGSIKMTLPMTRTLGGTTSHHMVFVHNLIPRTPFKPLVHSEYLLLGNGGFVILLLSTSRQFRS